MFFSNLRRFAITTCWCGESWVGHGSGIKSFGVGLIFGSRHGIKYPVTEFEGISVQWLLAAVGMVKNSLSYV